MEINLLQFKKAAESLNLAIHLFKKYSQSIQTRLNFRFSRGCRALINLPLKFTYIHFDSNVGSQIAAQLADEYIVFVYFKMQIVLLKYKKNVNENQ